jgi:Asp-tRNA(Asn)/Glu-tRNA(Gln) amidotransferase A subunit family amidase
VKPRTAFRLQEATVDGIHEAMRSGDISCRELVQLYIDRIDAYDQKGPSLNALQTLNQHAMAEADRLDAQFRASGFAGPLHGIPVMVKDQFETSGLPTTYGSALFRGFAPQRNATVVEKLKAAGAIILAKTNMGEFAAGCAGSAFGWCRNPYDPERDPSGSSSGTGIAMAANFGAVGIGEDTTGSIRGPAARNSLVGLRPTLPLVSRFGMMPSNPTRDTAGSIARTVRDTALLLDVLAGYDPNDPVTAASVGHVPATYTSFLDSDGLRGMRLGVIREVMASDTDPKEADFLRVRAAIDQALGELADCGAEIVDPVVIAGLTDLLPQTSGAFETEAAIDAYLAQHPNAPVKTLQEIVLSADVLLHQRMRLMRSIGRTTDELPYLHLMQTREALRQAVLKAMADHQVDALVYATFDHEPQRIPPDILTSPRSGLQKGSNRTLCPMVTCPALSVPAGFTDGGLPVGIEFLGRPFTEGTLLRIAYAYEQHTHHRQPPPTTPPLAGEP